MSAPTHTHGFTYCCAHNIYSALFGADVGGTAIRLC